MKYYNNDHKKGVLKLKKLNINTLSDLDKHKEKLSKHLSYTMSRYSALCFIVGEKSAVWIMNDLSLLGDNS